jgi:hypothetical protein
VRGGRRERKELGDGEEAKKTRKIGK